MYACKLRRPKTEDSTQGRYARCETCFVRSPKWVPVPRYYCKPTRAGVESPKEFTPPMQFRRFKDNSEAVRRDRVRQLFEVRYAEERTETGVLLFYAWLEKYHRELLPQQKRGDPYQNIEPFRAGVREGDWKLIWKTPLPYSIELYNIPQDPSEKTNLAAQNPEKVAAP